jgi:endonuclease/exonuclease/phosphatase family metal-dependent hydrolase
MKIRLGTFNLYQFAEPPYSWYTKKDKFNQRQWLEKTTWIKNQIEKMDCHIIGFQEVFSQNALEDLVRELGFQYFATVDLAKLSTHNKTKYVTTTVALASKYPISNIEKVNVHLPSSEKHHFREESKDPFQFSRIPIKASITLPNETELLVYVCHLKSNRLNEFEHVFSAQETLEHKKEVVTKALESKYTTALNQRLCEASSLFFDIEKSKHTPAVLLCDLNDKEFSITIDALSKHEYYDDTSKEHFILHDASYQYKPEIYNPHPEAKKVKRKATSYFSGKGNVLDYIFISNDFELNNKEKIAQVTDYTVLDDHLLENRNGSLLKSDHAQVVCELTFE